LEQLVLKEICRKEGQLADKLLSEKQDKLAENEKKTAAEKQKD
jgi:hypothetical protein